MKVGHWPLPYFGVTQPCTYCPCRASKPVHKYKLASAARNVKFSSGVMDLVAISEHEDVVHLADLRKWECVQQLNPGEVVMHAAPLSLLATSRHVLAPSA